MGGVFVQIGRTEYLIAEPGSTTFEKDGIINKGVTIPLENGETIVVFVNEHEESNVPEELGVADVRIELSKNGHKDGQVYQGDLPDCGMVDFETHGMGMISIAHGAVERKG